jgi:hypothetical protein
MTMGPLMDDVFLDAQAHGAPSGMTMGPLMDDVFLVTHS